MQIRAILLVKSKEKVKDSLHYLASGSTIQVLSTPWADSKYCRAECKSELPPMGDSSLCTKSSVFRNRFSLGIHAPTP